MKRLIALAVAVVLIAVLSGAASAQKAGAKKADEKGLKQDVLVEAFFQKRTADLPDMLKRHQVRVLVVPNRSTFFIDSTGQPRGLDYDLFKRWERWLNKGRKKGEPPVTVVFIPVTIEEVLPALKEGRGDIAGLSLVTPGRAGAFAYATPGFDNINEVVVTHKGSKPYSRLEDLAGQEVYVASGSAQEEGMLWLNKRLRNKGMTPVKVVTPAPYVTQENLLEMVHAGIIPACVVPDAIARMWNRVFKDLVINDNIPVTTGLEAGWAVRRNSPLLLANLNTAIAGALKKDKQIFEAHFNQYFVNTRWISNPFGKGSKARLVSQFEQEAAGFGMDWIKLMAQGFQESGLDHSVRSRVGAVGIMQVLPSTAREIGVPNYSNIDANIRAGAKLMSKFIDKYSKDPAVGQEDRFLFALAAYNSGPARLANYRSRAREMGYDPNKWFGNVERVALRFNNTETVVYVRNILNYTMAYKSAYEQALRRGMARSQTP